MRLMADTTDHSAPAGYDLYAGYIDGSYRSFPYLNAQHPGKTLSITVVGDASAQIVDVETGDITPAHAPGWVQRKGSTRYQLWVADYGIKACPLHGAVAWQRQDTGPHGENIDVSEVYDDGWPYAGIPTIYCPYSSVPAVMNACSAAGLTFVPAGAVAPAPAPIISQEEPVGATPLPVLEPGKGYTFRPPPADHTGGIPFGVVYVSFGADFGDPAIRADAPVPLRVAAWSLVNKAWIVTNGGGSFDANGKWVEDNAAVPPLYVPTAGDVVAIRWPGDWRKLSLIHCGRKGTVVPLLEYTAG